MGPGHREISSDYVIRRGDLLSLDWGVGHLNEWTEMTRYAYVLKSGEIAVPAGVQRAFDKGIAIRDVLDKTIKPGTPADEMLERLNGLVAALPGFAHIDLDKPHSTDPNVTDFIIGVHAIGFFSSTVVPERNGARIMIQLMDDALITEQGVQWLYPPSERILLIK